MGPYGPTLPYFRRLDLIQPARYSNPQLLLSKTIYT
jgi:hypothetical protein